MKKYLPSFEEFTTGVVIFFGAMVVWTFAGAPFINAITKAKNKVTGS